MVLGGPGRRYVVLMNQSSRDYTLLDVRPSPGPGRGAVSSQSSQDKRPKHSLPGTTVRKEGRAISVQRSISQRSFRVPSFNPGFDRFSGLYLWAGFILVFAFWVPNLFVTSGTLHSVASQQAVAAIVAIAVLVPMACGAYDLSVGATVNLATVTVTILQTDHGWSTVPAIVATVLVCALIGVINGFVVVRSGRSSPPWVRRRSSPRYRRSSRTRVSRCRWPGRPGVRSRSTPSSASRRSSSIC